MSGHVPSLTFFSDTVVTATNNGVGLLVAAGGQVGAPFEGATFVLHDNGVGMSLASGATTFLRAGLNVHDNATGILVDDAGLQIAAAPGLPNSITGNGTDVQLSTSATLMEWRSDGSCRRQVPTASRSMRSICSPR